jgi:hypothetical protein
MRRISIVLLASSPRERGFRCSVFEGFNARPCAHFYYTGRNAPKLRDEEFRCLMC